jgi:hypothetical protein
MLQLQLFETYAHFFYINRTIITKQRISCLVVQEHYKEKRCKRKDIMHNTINIYNSAQNRSNTMFEEND